MAVFPCDAGNHRYHGPQNTIYPAIVKGAEAKRRKLRLCNDHFAILRDRLEQAYHSDLVDYGDVEDLACPACHKPMGNDQSQFFASVYANGCERVDYWAPIHDGCAEALSEAWHLRTYMA